MDAVKLYYNGRTPPGVRELKQRVPQEDRGDGASHPSRGA